MRTLLALTHAKAIASGDSQPFSFVDVVDGGRVHRLKKVTVTDSGLSPKVVGGTCVSEMGEMGS